MIAISYWKTDRRQIKIFTKELQLITVCDHVDGLTGPIVWHYKNKYLQAVQKVDDGDLQLVSFDEYGQKFDSFSLQSRNSVSCLKWYQNEPVLFVIYAAIDNKTQVHIWLDISSKFYCKKVLNFDDLLCFRLGNDQVTLFDVITKHCDYLYYFYKIIDCSLVTEPIDRRYIAVIDGAHLILINISDGSNRSPVSKFLFNFEAEVAYVNFSVSNSREFIVYLENHTIMGFSIGDSSYEQIFQYKDVELRPEQGLEWIFYDEDLLFRKRFDDKMDVFEVKNRSLHFVPETEFSSALDQKSAVKICVQNCIFNANGFIVLPFEEYQKVSFHY